MSEGIQRVGLLIEIGGVAVHERFFVAEDDIALENLCVRYALLVKTESLRVVEINHGLGNGKLKMEN
jgi:hypothetical protein